MFEAASDSLSGKKLRDSIWDFSTGSDKIDVSSVDADEGVFGQQHFQWSGVAAMAHGLWFVQMGADIVVRGDTDGNRFADFEIMLTGITSVSASDFSL